MRCRHVLDLGVTAALHRHAARLQEHAGDARIRLAPGSPHALGRDPTDVVLVDVDGDRRLDAVTTSVESGELHVLRGDGRGGFATGIAILAAPALHSVVGADLDADGDVDLLGTQHDSHDVNVLLGDGRGGFSSRPTPRFAARVGGKPHNHGLVVADFDEDGRLDALTSDQDANSVALLLGDGRGGLAIAFRVAVAGRTPPVSAGRRRSRRRRPPRRRLPARRRCRGGRLARRWRRWFRPRCGRARTAHGAAALAGVGDVTGDGRIDAVVAHDDTSIATVLVGDGAGGSSATHTLDLGGRGYDLALVDMDADAKLDLLGTRVPDGVMVLLGDGSGGFVPAPGSPYAVGKEPSAIAVGDLDGDGKLDLVAANFESGDLTVLLQE